MEKQVETKETESKKAVEIRGITETFTHNRTIVGGWLTICTLSNNGEPVSIGLALYNVHDMILGNPYKRTFGNQIARARAYKAFRQGKSSSPVRREYQFLTGHFAHKCIYLAEEQKPTSLFVKMTHLSGITLVMTDSLC